MQLKEFQNNLKDKNIDTAIFLTYSMDFVDPNFFYFTQLDIDFGCLVIQKKGKPLLFVSRHEYKRARKECRRIKVISLPKNKDFFKFLYGKISTDNIKKIGSDPVFYSNPYHLAACLMLDKSEISKFSPNLKINTDNLSYLEFFSSDCFNQDNLNKNIAFLSDNRSDLNTVFSNHDDPRQMNRFVEGSQLFIQSSIHFQNNDRQKSLDELRKAVRTNPENQEYPFLIKFYFNVDR